MTELLTEIERFNGIIFMATNRPQVRAGVRGRGRARVGCAPLGLAVP